MGMYVSVCSMCVCESRRLQRLEEDLRTHEAGVTGNDPPVSHQKWMLGPKLQSSSLVASSSHHASPTTPATVTEPRSLCRHV